MKKRISVYTLGCKLNFSETDVIARSFIEKGYELVPFGKEADVSIINTCTVTAQGERKSKFAVKKAHKVSPDAKIIVVGCASQINPTRFQKIEGVDIVIGNINKTKVYDLLEQKNIDSNQYSCDINLIENFEHAYSVEMRTRSFLKIQDGCDYHCTYCTIPKARGKSRNDTISKIVEDAYNIAERGVKEIILTGVNIGDFGKSTGETFLQLIKELDKVEGIERYRISSIEPNLLNDEIINFVANSQKFMPHFHIPLQSGSDDVLKLMKRRYNTSRFADRVLKAYNTIPDAFFGIDVIVGFPGETDENFEETYALLKHLPISFLHIFPYSDRNGTPASKMKPKIPSEQIKNREIKLKKLSDKKHLEFYQKYIGQNKKVLFEQKENDGLFVGYTDNYLRVKVKTEENLKNKILNVQLLELRDGFIYGNYK